MRTLQVTGTLSLSKCEQPDIATAASDALFGGDARSDGGGDARGDGRGDGRGDVGGDSGNALAVGGDGDGNGSEVLRTPPSPTQQAVVPPSSVDQELMGMCVSCSLSEDPPRADTFN
jgi:hypothetical protein